MSEELDLLRAKVLRFFYDREAESPGEVALTQDVRFALGIGHQHASGAIRYLAGKGLLEITSSIRPTNYDGELQAARITSVGVDAIEHPTHHRGAISPVSIQFVNGPNYGVMAANSTVVVSRLPFPFEEMRKLAADNVEAQEAIAELQEAVLETKPRPSRVMAALENLKPFVELGAPLAQMGANPNIQQFLASLAHGILGH